MKGSFRFLACLLAYLLVAGNASAGTAATSNNGFTFDLYARVNRDENKNLVFSPASIMFALGMTFGGARGETAAEMSKALRYGEMGGRDEVTSGLGALMAQLNAEGRKPGVELRVVNRNWVQEGFPWSKAFLETARKAWEAGIEQGDFTSAAEKLRKTINAWVEKQTSSRIKDLLPDGAVDASTVMVLVNAIYFKGQWVHKFDKKNTRGEDFFTASGKKVQAPLMHQTATLLHGTAPGLQLVEMPYKNTSLAMDLIVPDEVKGLPAVEKQLNGETLGKWLSGLAPADDLELTMPRFEVTVPLSLAPLMAELGMKQAFQPYQADLTGMLDPAAKQGHSLYISAILHKAFVRVDEEGSEAAAATAVTVGDAAVHFPPKVRADRPFIWLIRDTKSGAILFIGRVTDPTLQS